MAEGLPSGEQKQLDCSNITLKWNGRTEKMSFPMGATTADLSRAITTMLDIPQHAQKLFVPGKIGLIKPLLHAPRPLTDLAGKTIRLLGATQTEIKRIQAATIEHRKAGTIAQERRLETQEAFRQLDEKKSRAAPWIGQGIPAYLAALTPEEVEDVGKNGRHFGRLAPPLWTTSRQRLEGLIGLGVIPRIRCQHVEGSPEYYGCERCRDTFIVEWHCFVTDHLFTMATETKKTFDRMAELAPSTRISRAERAAYTAALDDYNRRYVAVVGAWEAEVPSADLEPLLEETEIMLSEIQFIENDILENDDADEVEEDFRSFAWAADLLAYEEPIDNDPCDRVHGVEPEAE